VATALQLYASQLRTTARSLAERLTASILAPLIRVASPNVSTLTPLTKSKGARSYIPSCYGSSEISLRNSDSGQALTVRVRTFPSELIASANLATLSPFGVSTMRRRSSSPEVK
jgi:hypothetical protein